MDIRATDNSIFTVVSDVFTIRVSDEYLVTTPSVDGKSGMLFDFAVRNMSDDILTPNYPISLDIYDDVSSTIVATDITIPTGSYTLPTEYTKTT